MKTCTWEANPIASATKFFGGYTKKDLEIALPLASGAGLCDDNLLPNSDTNGYGAHFSVVSINSALWDGSSKFVWAWAT